MRADSSEGSEVQDGLHCPGSSLQTLRRVPLSGSLTRVFSNDIDGEATNKCLQEGADRIRFLTFVFQLVLKFSPLGPMMQDWIQLETQIETYLRITTPDGIQSARDLLCYVKQ